METSPGVASVALGHLWHEFCRFEHARLKAAQSCARNVQRSSRRRVEPRTNKARSHRTIFWAENGIRTASREDYVGVFPREVAGLFYHRNWGLVGELLTLPTARCRVFYGLFCSEWMGLQRQNVHVFKPCVFLDRGRLENPERTQHA